MSSKRFAGEVIWGSCALGFNETCFGFCGQLNKGVKDAVAASTAVSKKKLKFGALLELSMHVVISQSVSEMLVTLLISQSVFQPVT